MTGDQIDMRHRLRLTLPARWFGDVAPILDGILLGFGSAWATLYQLLQFVIGQSRIKTATDVFLDMAAQDFLGDSLPRRPQEGDISYRTRLQAAMRRQQATRAAIVDAAYAAGYEVTIFEPAQPVNTGAYNVSSGLAWNVSGGWGSLAMPFECLVVAKPVGAPFENELWRNVSDAMPAGGAAWLRVTS